VKGVVSAPSITVHRTFIELDGRAAIGVLRIPSVYLDMQTEGERRALHRLHQELLDTITFPISIYARQCEKDLEPHLDHVANQDGDDDLRAAYLDYCRWFSEQGIIDTEHFIVVRVIAGNHVHTVKELYRRLQVVAGVFAGTQLHPTHVTGEALRSFAGRSANPSPVPTRRFSSTAASGVGEYRKLFYIRDYPSAVRLGWPLSLLRVDGFVDVLQIIEPVPVKRAMRTLRRRATNLSADLTAALRSGHPKINKYERLLDDIEWFLDVLAEQRCQPVTYGVYVIAHAPTREQAFETADRVKSMLHAFRINFKEPGYRNDYAYYTDSPFYGDRLDETLLMPSTAAASGFSFGTQPFENSQGMLYGIDTTDRTPILLDRFSWESHSMAVMGTLGSGKSYLAHLELIRSKLCYPEIRIIVIDPKKEYRSTVEALGGKSIILKHGAEYSFDEQVTSFEPRQRGESENVALLAELLEQIYAVVSKDRHQTLVLVDEAHNLLDDEAGRSVLREFVLEARDINTAVHMVSQSASHFTEYWEGCDILDHVAGEILFRHKKINESMREYFDFPQEREADLRNLPNAKQVGYSQAFLRVDNVVDTKISIWSTSLEHQLIDTERPQLEGEVIQ